MKKRVITLLLAVVMLVSLLPVALSAEAATKCKHTKWKWKTTKAATCTACGTKEKICSKCNKRLDTRTIKALGHNLKTTTDATCTKNGEKITRCTRSGCPYSTKSTKIKALGHDWRVFPLSSKDIKCLTINGTKFSQYSYLCTAFNLNKRKCARCGEIDGVVINGNRITNKTNNLKCSCQGMAISGGYVYTAIDHGWGNNRENKTTSIIRTDSKGNNVLLTYEKNNTYDIGHVNGMCAFENNGFTFLFVTGRDDNVFRVLKIKTGTSEIIKIKKYVVDRPDSNNKLIITGLATLQSPKQENGYEAEIILSEGINKKDYETLYTFKLKVEKDEITTKDIALTKVGIMGKEIGWASQDIAYHNGKIYAVVAESSDPPTSKILVYNYKDFNGSNNKKVNCENSYQVTQKLELEGIDFNGDTMYVTGICWYKQDSAFDWYTNRIFSGKLPK